jgi:hypothetical protein
MSPIQKAIEENRFIPHGNRVLVRTVSILEDKVLSAGGVYIKDDTNRIVAPGDSDHQDKNAAYYLVVAKGPLVSDEIQVGQKIMHVAAAADKVVAAYGIIREDFIVGHINEGL